MSFHGRSPSSRHIHSDASSHEGRVMGRSAVSSATGGQEPGGEWAGGSTSLSGDDRHVGLRALFKALEPRASWTRLEWVHRHSRIHCWSFLECAMSAVLLDSALQLAVFMWSYF
jgi:hypothetical protein